MWKELKRQTAGKGALGWISRHAATLIIYSPKSLALGGKDRTRYFFENRLARRFPKSSEGSNTPHYQPQAEQLLFLILALIMSPVLSPVEAVTFFTKVVLLFYFVGVTML